MRAIKVALVLTLLAMPQCARAECPIADQSEIRQAYATWMAAHDRRDVSGVMAIFDPSVTFQFQGVPDQDWNALRRSYQAEFAAQGGEHWSPDFGAIALSGDIAAAFSIWRLTVTDASGKPAVTATNNSVDLFRRDQTCQWRIIRSLNYPIK